MGNHSKYSINHITPVNKEIGGNIDMRGGGPLLTGGGGYVRSIVRNICIWIYEYVDIWIWIRIYMDTWIHGYLDICMYIHIYNTKHSIKLKSFIKNLCHRFIINESFQTVFEMIHL